MHLDEHVDVADREGDVGRGLAQTGATHAWWGQVVRPRDHFLV